MSFHELGLSADLLHAVDEAGYAVPTPIQREAIPRVLEGHDVLAAARTGTGKTAAFALPLLQRLLDAEQAIPGPRVLVLVPTRELAAQVGDAFRAFGRGLPLRSAVIFGGVGIHPQIDVLKRGVDVLVATPGRLLDHLQQRTLNLSQVNTLVLDEADRMLDMGFIRDIRKVLAALPRQRQSLLFSATFNREIRTLAEGLLRDPVTIDVAPRNSAAEQVAQRVHPVDSAGKAALLAHLIRDGAWQQVLVFTRTKHGANRLAEKLNRADISAGAIHGNKSQSARTRALADFKAGRLRVLVATDIAARGIDIDQLPYVVNYELPAVPEDYVHRIGRTGRAERAGEAISLVGADEKSRLRDIQKLLRCEIPSSVVAGFEPGTASRADDDEPRRPRQAATARRDNQGGSGRAAAKPARKGPSRKSRGSGGADWRNNQRPHKSAEHRAGKSRKVH